MSYITLLTRPVQTHPRPDPPGGSDRRPIRNRPTRLFRWSTVGLGLQNPKMAGWLAGFLSKTRRNPTESRSQHFPAKLFTSGEISAISTNSKKIRRKYHWNFVDFVIKLPDFGRFSDLKLQPNRPPSVEGPICPIQSTSQSTASWISGRRFRVGHKPDLDRPVDKPNADSSNEASTFKEVRIAMNSKRSVIEV